MRALTSTVSTVFLAATLAAGQAITWDEAYQKAATDLAALSQDEKVGIVTGVTWMQGPCVGNTYKPESISYPSLCLQDGPLSVRFANPVTVFPAGINAGATWDRELIRARGAAMGEQSKALGVHVQLGPALGALGKIPSAGRNWEGFSNDPYLMGIATAEAVQGMQGSGVQACAKVFSPSRVVLFNANHNSTSFSMSKSITARLLAPLLMTGQCMSCICGHSMMPSRQMSPLLCARITKSTGLGPARTMPS